MKLIIGYLLFCCAFITNAADTMTMEANKSLPQFRVRLPANPTTGYQWTVKQYDKKLFSLIDSTYIAPKTQLIGAGGEMVFTFVLQPDKTYPQKTVMIFKYARPWESKGASFKKVIIRFKSSISTNKQTDSKAQKKLNAMEPTPE
ncbi:protease inhibitor I42 family protein [Legionella nagasakiensis]|uniref:protease inhibitor I42 family protein n=1 Tax=Legionella nagasakiensis TaxID=535290 RepID=UPI0010557248|nr:protease inhibitor I42 family protein [Legionella nagasakiensis]